MNRLSSIQWRKRLLVFEGFLVALLTLGALGAVILFAANRAWSLVFGFVTLVLLFCLFLNWVRLAWRAVTDEERVSHEGRFEKQRQIRLRVPDLRPR